MRKVAIAFSILGIVLAAIGVSFVLLTGIVLITNTEVLINELIKQYPEISMEVARSTIVMMAIGFFISVIPCAGGIVVNALSIHFVRKSKSRTPLIVLGILSILFASLVSGILMLCIRDETNA